MDSKGWSSLVELENSLETRVDTLETSIEKVTRDETFHYWCIF